MIGDYNVRVPRHPRRSSGQLHCRSYFISSRVFFTSFSSGQFAAPVPSQQNVAVGTMSNVATCRPNQPAGLALTSGPMAVQLTAASAAHGATYPNYEAFISNYGVKAGRTAVTQQFCPMYSSQVSKQRRTSFF
jgi:hypothetical protein